MAKATLLWVDLEMTGLSPEKDRILEVACVGTDWNFNEVAKMTAIVKVDEEVIKRRMVGRFWDEHAETRAELIKQNQDGEPIEDVEERILEFLDENFEVESIRGDSKGKGKIILAGNSVHQDKKFIEREMPLLNDRLHYRMLDVSAWKVYFEAVKKKKFTKRETHRALDDIQGSIDELKYYLTFLKD